MWAIATLSDPVNDGVRYYGNLLALVVQQQMVAAKKRPRDIPGKVIRLDVRSEHVRQKPRERSGERLNGVVENPVGVRVPQVPLLCIQFCSFG